MKNLLFLFMVILPAQLHAQIQGYGIHETKKGSGTSKLANNIGQPITPEDRKVNLVAKTDMGLIDVRSIHWRVKTDSLRYMDLRIKNNSSNRLNAYVKGPKPDGHFFSYGFPMWPGQVRRERWTIGTKVYRTTSLGLRKELITIKATHDHKVVPLY